jgi:putative flippase GtrA
VVRGTKREVISRCYNLILRGTLGARFTDAQCGFKAIRSDVAAELLPLVEDPTWFFDTELLVLAQRSGLRIHEVPVDWFDDPDSRVDVVGTALDDLRGVVRVRRALASGRLPVADIAARIGRHAPGSLGANATDGRRPGSGSAWHQLTRFAAVGAASTVLHLGLFAVLAPALESTQTANLLALLLATVVNTAMNRRWTFGVHGPGAVRHQLQGLSIFVLTWLLTAGALALLHAVVSSPSTTIATLVVATATAASTGLRFIAMRTWIFRSSPPDLEPQYSVTMNVPSASSNTTTPVQSKPSTEPWHTVTSP